MRKAFTILFLLFNFVLMAQGDITKEFQYENFVKYCDAAKDHMDGQRYFKAASSIIAAKFAAKSLIRKGFENEIKPQLNELDQYQNQIDGNKAGDRNLKAAVAEAEFWERNLESFYRMPSASFLGSLEGELNNGRSNIAPFERGHVIALINTIKASPEYTSASSSESVDPNDKVALAKQRRSRATSGQPKSTVDRGKIDRLEDYIINVDNNLIAFDMKEAIGEKISTINTATNKETMNRDIQYLKTLMEVLLKIDPNNGYASIVQRKVIEMDVNSTEILANNNFEYQHKANGNFNTLPSSAQENKDLDEELLTALSGQWPGYVLKNTIFIDKDWVIEKDDDGHDFSRSIQVWITVDQELTPNCYAKQTTFIQYYSGTETGKTRKYENGKKYSVSCDLVDALYVKSGKSKLPIALMNDAALSQKLMAAARNKGTNGDTVVDAILNTKGWGENRNNYGHVISRSRMGVIVSKNASGDCFYQYHLFKQKVSDSGYGAAFIQKILSRKTQFDCSQMK